MERGWALVRRSRLRWGGCGPKQKQASTACTSVFNPPPRVLSLTRLAGEATELHTHNGCAFPHVYIQ